MGKAHEEKLNYHQPCTFLHVPMFAILLHSRIMLPIQRKIQHKRKEQMSLIQAELLPTRHIFACSHVCNSVPLKDNVAHARDNPTQGKRMSVADTRDKPTQENKRKE